MSTGMVEGEASARRNPRKGKVSVFRLWPGCRTFGNPAPGTAEEQHFRRVEAQVARGGGGGGGARGQEIQCVEYAVNPTLEAAYNEKKEEMTRRLGSAGVNERLLFHGTSFRNSEAILRENFRLEMVGSFSIRLVAQLAVRTFQATPRGAGRKPDASVDTPKRLSLSHASTLHGHLSRVDGERGWRKRA